MKIVRDRTVWPAELMHAEMCSWRFGANAVCDCGKSPTSTTGISDSLPDFEVIPWAYQQLNGEKP